MDDKKPIEILKNDHRKVEDLFGDFHSSNPEDYQKIESIVKKVCMNLKVHARIEEELFYPELEKVSEEGRSMISDSRKEHDEMKNLIAQLEDIHPESETYLEKFKSLERAVIHHVGEEEAKIFPFAEKNIPDGMGMGMVAKMMAMKGSGMVKEEMGNL